MSTVRNFLREVIDLRLYLDMCCYNRPYDDQSQIKVSLEAQAKLHIQKLIQERELELVASYMLRYECSQNPYEMRRKAILEFVDTNTAAYVGLNRKNDVEANAEEIMKTGVKFKDACHVASAILAGCEYFVSTDIRLLKYKTDKIKLVGPVEFLTETEGE